MGCSYDDTPGPPPTTPWRRGLHSCGCAGRSSNVFFVHFSRETLVQRTKKRVDERWPEGEVMSVAVKRLRQQENVVRRFAHAGENKRPSEVRPVEQRARQRWGEGGGQASGHVGDAGGGGPLVRVDDAHH